MSKSNNNGTTKTASNTTKGSRRGPRPIMTVAQIRERMLREMLIKEGRKVERKIGKLLKREAQLQLKLDSTRTQLDNLRITLAEFNAELGA